MSFRSDGRTGHRGTHRRTTAGPLFVVGFLLAVAGEALAQKGGGGSLFVAPTRLLFEGRSRSAELSLTNVGSETATYRIGMKFYSMGQAGEMIEVPHPSPEDHAAHEIIRYSPRQVTLRPGESQSVRVAVRKPADLPAGEYRSHLFFTPVPTNPGRSASEEAVGAILKLNVSVSIAVIVRHGETSVTASLDPVAFSPGRGEKPPGVEVTIRRSGDRSLYGKLVASYVPQGGRPIEVGVARGIGVYASNPYRRFRLSLKPPNGVTFKKGRLDIQFVDEEAKPRVLAEATVEVP